MARKELFNQEGIEKESFAASEILQTLFHTSDLQFTKGTLKYVEKFSMGKFTKGGSCKLQLP